MNSLEEKRNIFNEIEEDKINKLIEKDFDKDLINYSPNNFYLVNLKCNNCIVKILKDKENTLYQYIVNSKKNIFTLFTQTIRKIEYDENYNSNIPFYKNQDLFNLGRNNDINLNEIYFIISMRHNYRILKKLFPDEIPDAKFSLVYIEGFDMPEFAVFQKYINGKNLWGLYHNNIDEFKIKLNLPHIKEKMMSFINCKYIDLNIKNFIIDNNDNIFYVDIKPTYLSYKKYNEINKKSLLKYIDKS